MKAVFQSVLMILRIVIVVFVTIVFCVSTAITSGAKENGKDEPRAYAYQDDDFIVIGNESIEATFCVSLLYAICSIKDKVHGTDLVGDTDAVFALWWLQATADDDVKDLFSASSDFENTSHTIESAEDQARILIVWERLFDGEEWLEIQVTVEITVRIGDNFLDWGIKTENGGSLALVKVYFPLITGITVLGESGQDDRLAYPYLEGYLIDEPLDALTTGIAWQGFTDSGAGDWRFSSDYPGMVSLQLLSFYEEESGGFYLTTLDSSARAKGFPLAAAEGWFLLSVLHYPNDFSPGNVIEQPYPLHIGVFEGDWQDAALIYRDWAVTQPWTSKGKLSARPDIPEWWKKSGLTLHLESYNDWGVEEISMEDGKLVVEFLDKKLASHLTVRWRGGFQVLRPAEIDEFTAFTDDHNASVIYHTNGRLDMGLTEPPLSNAAALDWHNIPYTEDNEYWTGTIMCPAAAPWRDHLLGQWSEVLDHGSNGIYVDQIAVSPWVPCWDPQHGHELGRTALWWVAQQFSLQNEAEQRIGQISPPALWTSEMQSEAYLPLYTSALSWQVGVETLFGMRFEDHARFIPIFQFVYGEYSAPFGADSPLTDWTKESPILDYNLAYDFISGKCPGVFHNPGGNFDIEKLDTPTFHYLLKLAELRADQLSSFLFAGKMLKDPQIEVERLSVPFENLNGDQYRIHNTTAILYSTWKAPDGRAAIILTNWQDHMNRIEIKVAPHELEVSPGTPLLSFTESGSTVLEPSWFGDKTIELTLQPRSTQVIIADPGHVVLPSPRRSQGRRGP